MYVYVCICIYIYIYTYTHRDIYTQHTQDGSVTKQEREGATKRTARLVFALVRQFTYLKTPTVSIFVIIM